MAVTSTLDGIRRSRNKTTEGQFNKKSHRKRQFSGHRKLSSLANSLIERDIENLNFSNQVRTISLASWHGHLNPRDSISSTLKNG